VVWFGAGLVLLTSVGVWAHGRSHRDVPFKTAAVSRGAIESSVSATGNLNAVVTVQVGAQVSGNIQQLYADFNTRVKKDQLIARIDPQVYQARVDQAKANVEAARAAVSNAQAALQKSIASVANANSQQAIAQANLAKEKVNLGDARTKYGRQMQLFELKLIATADRDSAQATYDAEAAAVDASQAQVRSAQEAIRAAEADRDVAATSVTQAEAAVKQQQAALQQAQIDLDHTYIYAPVEGTVISRQVDVGQTVVSSLQAPALFQIAQDLTKMQIDTNVDEADVGRVQVAQDVTFTVDAFPTRRFQARVVEIRKAAINVQNVITYDVVIAVANPDQKLLPGMTANVRILTDRRDDALRVPNAALRYRPADAKAARNAAPAVWLAGEDGKPTPVKVTLGISDGAYTEIAGGELHEGDQVIVGAATQAVSSSRPFGGGPRF
jgi:HlyD family secretion protein